jgi:hypothetical protein
MSPGMLATVGRGGGADGVWPGTAPPSIILCIRLHWRLVYTYEADLGARPWLDGFPSRSASRMSKPGVGCGGARRYRF